MQNQTTTLQDALETRFFAPLRLKPRGPNSERVLLYLVG